MAKPKVLLDVPFPDFLNEVFAEHCDFVPWTALESGNGALSEIAAVLTYAHPRLADPQLDLLPNIKVVSNYGVGVDHIDVPAVLRRNIALGNTPGVVDAPTADMTMALLLSIARNVVIGDAYARGPDFLSYDPANMLGRDVFGATLGIVGMGSIGRQVAQRARAFDMKLIYHNRSRNLVAERELGANYVSMHELLEQADFVSLNVPLTDETQGMFGRDHFKRMKPTAFLINTSRGAVVDHSALREALTEGWVAGVATDVTEPEPLPRDDPLLALRNLVITPHLGTSTFGSRLRMAHMTLANLRAGLHGEPLLHPVTT